jgi:dipeptidyl aminopeptidase/acylaminoacyl peptidase
VFSLDSKTVAFTVFPAKSAIDQAKKEKKPAPKDGMAIVDLGSGKVFRVDRVKRFAMPEKASGVLVYAKEGPDAPSASKPASGASATPEFGADLVIRNLNDGSERTVTDVAEFALSDDAKTLVYAIAAHEPAKNGVFAVTPGATAAPVSVLEGKGKYSKLTWDENQTQLAFLRDRDDAAAKEAKWKLYRWERGESAKLVAAGGMPGLRNGFAISDKGTLSFSKDGTRIFFGCAPALPEKKDAASDSEVDDTKAVVDVWSYKDDYIQPMQKVRAEKDRNRTFTAAYLIPEKRIVQLGDEKVETVTPSESARWSLGTDDRAFRAIADYDEHYLDAYMIDVTSGERKVLAKKQWGTLTWSPAGRYLLYFDGNDWNTLSVPDGKNTNLTAKLGVKFFNEDIDTPNVPGPYGNAGWTRDGKYVLLYSRYDIWRVSPDGSGAINLTAGYGAAHDVRLRYVRTAAPNPREPWIDGAKPLMLSAENLKTFETGFFSGSLEGGAPRQLVMMPKTFGPPIKAKDADVYLLTVQSFTECPNLITADGSFQQPRKISDANPQMSKLLWGTSEVVRFTNADGVPLTGALYKPANFDPKQKYPMMVYLYERLTQAVNRFVDPRPTHNINISYYTSNGYVVFTPDIVYTTGFPGQSALKCVLPGVQAVVDMGFVDENAIGIQGHSWGGYEVAYLVTHTNRFRAAAAGAAVADMISAYDGVRWGSGLSRQAQYERTQSRIGGSIWQFPTRFVENSPIFSADRVQTPVMLLHNDGDDAVPWYQGVEFYLALRRLGKEVYLFNYNGEPHGLRKRPNQKDYTIRLQQYFDHYLKGAPAPKWMENGVPYLERERTELSTIKEKE